MSLIKSKETNGVTLLNGNFEEYGVKGWTPYKGTASDTPLNEVYTTPSFTSIVASSNTPLVGLQSGLINKASGDARGEGVYTDFSLDEGLLASPIQIDFIYKTSADYVSNVMAVYIMDLTSNTLIYPSMTDINISTNASIFKCVFIPSTSKNYRLFFHIKTIDAIAYQIRLDELNIGSKVVLTGAAIGVTQTYPLTIGATTTPPTKGTIVQDIATWTRRGDKMAWNYRYKQSSAGGAGSGSYLFPLPSGFTIDTTKHPIGSAVGYCKLSNDVAELSISTVVGVVVVASATAFYLTTVSPSTSDFLSNMGSTSFSLPNANLSINAQAEVTIAEWTSNVNLATDFQEFASNSSATDANDTTSFVYGPGGSAGILRATTLASTRRKRVRFTRPIQATDKLILEFYVRGLWVPVELANLRVTSVAPLLISRLGTINGTISDTNTAGVGLEQVNATDVDVVFGRWFWWADGGAVLNWSDTNFETGVKWRVRKVSNGNMAEQPDSIKPIGEVTMFCGPTAPHGWLLCNGEAVSRSTYSRLFSVIGTGYGTGDGSTTFNLPDFREAVPVGAGAHSVVAGSTHTAQAVADTFTLGQFKDDQTQTHTHVMPEHGTGARSPGGGTNQPIHSSIGLGATTASNNGRTGTTTRTKELGINFIVRWM
jgi:microcystin-dependent protein